MNELIKRARSHGDSIAIRRDNDQHSYDDLLRRSASCASALLDGQQDLKEARVAYLLPAGVDHTAVQWGIWRSGGVAVPLSLSATEPELEYAITDAQCSFLLTNHQLEGRVAASCDAKRIRLLLVDRLGTDAESSLPAIDPSRRAMILYTSGTTSKPKGVVSTHANVQAQIETLVDAWQWQREDCIPLFLPLHHIHGIINVMSCALWAGATIETFPRFEMEAILNRVAARGYSVFMAVPTIYVKLIESVESLPESQRQQVIEGFAGMRLMVSGSAALPASVHEKWTELTGQRLLERYGMTEIGMALSNPYDGQRRPGAVGRPLPGVDIRLRSDDGEVVSNEGKPGEIQVRGRCVFDEYWNRPQATAESFDGDWFRTGDIAVLESGYFRIMGRQSVDIIKSGGYKLSALEIESTLLDHPAIDQCAVVGVPDETWGEAVAVAAVVAQPLDLASLKSWCKDRLSPYKIPKRLTVVDQLPRNAMGKIQKPAVRELF